MTWVEFQTGIFLLWLSLFTGFETNLCVTWDVQVTSDVSPLQLCWSVSWASCGLLSSLCMGRNKENIIHAAAESFSAQFESVSEWIWCFCLCLSPPAVHFLSLQLADVSLSSADLISSAAKTKNQQEENRLKSTESNLETTRFHYICRVDEFLRLNDWLLSYTVI